MVVNKKFVISYLILLIVTINFVYAQSPLILSEVKDSYARGEYFLVNGSINNLFEYPVLVNVESLLSNEKGALPLAVTPFEFNLVPGEEKNMELYDFLIDDNMVSDRYTFEIRVLFNRQEVTKRSFDFDIISVKEFSFNIELDKKIFTQNEEINIDYSSEVENPLLVSVLTYPDKTTQQIILPFSFTAEQIGTYTLDITASKEGYKTITKKEQFAVIESEAELSYLDMSQIPSQNYSKSSSRGIYLVIGLVILILIVLVIVFILRGRKKKEESGNPTLNIY